LSGDLADIEAEPEQDDHGGDADQEGRPGVPSDGLAEAWVGGQQEAIQQERDEGIPVPTSGFLGAESGLDEGHGQGEQEDRPGLAAEGGQPLQEPPTAAAQVQKEREQEEGVDQQEPQMRWFEQVRRIIRADEPGELETEVELEEVPVELPVGAGILLFEALLVVDLWGTTRSRPTRNGTNSRVSRSRMKPVAVRERSEYQAPRPDTTNSSGIPHSPANSTNSVSARLGGWSFT
jgi:hypothetical protein